MFDVFYFGEKPNLFEFEQPATSLENAAELSRTKFYWYIYGGNDYSKFDFEWRPVPWEADHVHVFPSQWQQDGGIYLANKDTVQSKQWHWRTEQSVTRLSDKTNWVVPEDMDESNIDFSWHPTPLDPPYVYHFSSDWQTTTGLTYTVAGATEMKIIDEIPSTDKTKVLKAPDIFYINRNNVHSVARFLKLQQRYPNIINIRYANSMMDTITRCCNRSTTNRFWVISSDCNYDKFDFTWHPETWQGFMTHVFPSQWNKWSDTFLINRNEFVRNSKWAKGIEEFPNLNFVQDQTVNAEDDGSRIYYVDQHNDDGGQLDRLRVKYPNIKVTRFADNYLDTFKRIMSTADTEYVWIINSICNYSMFDFSWQPEPWQAQMIHVFGSAMQKRGDTFYIHVESFKKQMYELEMLDWFNVINYCGDMCVDRLDAPIVKYTEDSIVPAIKAYDFQFPYALFTNDEQMTHIGHDPCLWHAKDRVAEAITGSGSTSIIHRSTKSDLQTQVYDYPYINRHESHFLSDKPLDIVYISNGEPDEVRWYNHTMHSVTGGMPVRTLNRVKWVHRVNGRTAAYQAAARASDTPWFFAVFAKLEVVSGFDWNWQPDYWQEPKHYIFNSHNPLNGLEYGHQGVIAYNKKMVLENNAPGIDFTLSQPHESVPILSGTAHFNQSSWMAWRTAFREVLKLKHFMATHPTLETEHRLKVWLTKAEGEHAEWCLRGAADAELYYYQVGGNYADLMKSFEWDWLQEKFNQCKNV